MGTEPGVAQEHPGTNKKAVNSDSCEPSVVQRKYSKGPPAGMRRWVWAPETSAGQGQLGPAAERGPGQVFRARQLQIQGTVWENTGHTPHSQSRRQHLSLWPPVCPFDSAGAAICTFGSAPPACTQLCTRAFTVFQFLLKCELRGAVPPCLLEINSAPAPPITPTRPTVH